MFDVLFFSEPSTASRRKNKLALMGFIPACKGLNFDPGIELTTTVNYQ
jgi:hypothetical protein